MIALYFVIKLGFNKIYKKELKLWVKKIKRCLSMLLALIITSSSAIAAAADTVDVVDEPDVLNEPYTFEWTEDAQTEEIEVKSDVLDKADEEDVSEDGENIGSAAEEEDIS